jgi:hypothetical protein
VTFTVSTDDLASYNPQMKLATDPGAFEAWIAPDSASGQKIDFAVVR